MTVENNDDQFAALAATRNEKPFVMLNLLKFKQEEGRERYLRYVKESSPFAQGVGASVEYFGIPKELLNGAEDWDLLMLIKYPSRKAFLEVIDDPGYLEAHRWRHEAVERAVLYATDPAGFKDILTQ